VVKRDLALSEQVDRLQNCCLKSGLGEAPRRGEVICLTACRLSTRGTFRTMVKRKNDRYAIDNLDLTNSECRKKGADHRRREKAKETGVPSPHATWGGGGGVGGGGGGGGVGGGLSSNSSPLEKVSLFENSNGCTKGGGLKKSSSEVIKLGGDETLTEVPD